MRLAERNAAWWTDDRGGTSRVVGLRFDCPCGRHPIHVAFANPPDGGAPTDFHSIHWQRDGETLDTLTLAPSIRARCRADEGDCWHGFIRNGEVINA